MRPSPVRRLAFALVAALAALAALEGAGRLLLVDPRTVPQVDGDRGLDLPYDPLTTLVAEHPDGTREFARGGDTFLGAQVWRVPRSDSAVRIGAVGDSTVYSRFPGKVVDGLVLPRGRAELINFGVRSLASDRVAIVLRTALRQDPSLVFVYVGHNEFLDARLNPQSLEPFDVRVRRSAVLNGGLGRLLRALLGWVDPAAPDAEPGARRGPKEGELGPISAPERETVLASYRRNLAMMCVDAREAGVPIAFVEPISSLVHSPETVDPERKLAMGGFREVEEAVQAGRPVDWEGLYAKAREGRTPWEAGIAWLDGMRAIAEGRPAEAVAPLERARALDEHPWRVEESRLAVLREVAAACGATLIATQPGFLADERYLAAGDPLFVDQVHPSPEGRVLLAGIVAEGLRPLLPPGTRWEAPTRLSPGDLELEPHATLPDGRPVVPVPL